MLGVRVPPDLPTDKQYFKPVQAKRVNLISGQESYVTVTEKKTVGEEN